MSKGKAFPSVRVGYRGIVTENYENEYGIILYYPRRNEEKMKEIPAFGS
jgi:hypothetical protein